MKCVIFRGVRHILSLNGLNIGLWCGYGCTIMLNSAPPPYPPGCVAAWIGFMVITQGGDPFFGQQSRVEVFSNGATYQMNRDCGNGVIQSATLGNPQMIQLVGTSYQCISGPSSGPGTGGALCQILAIGPS